jgi:hypothetical protein
MKEREELFVEQPVKQVASGGGVERISGSILQGYA